MAHPRLSTPMPFKVSTPTIVYLPLYYLQQGVEELLQPPYRNPNRNPQSSMQPPGFQYRLGSSVLELGRLHRTLGIRVRVPIRGWSSLMEQFIASQAQTNELLSASINQLTSKLRLWLLIRKRWTCLLYTSPSPRD